MAIDALRTVLGQDFGLTRVQGFLATTDYIVHAHGPSGQGFSYADSRATPLACVPAQVGFARERQAAWELPPSAASPTDKSLVGDRLLALALTRRFDLPERQRLVLSDRITELAQAGTVRWQLVTRAHVVIAEDGRQARLTQDGRTLEVAVESPADARLVVAEAVGSQP